MNPGETQEWPAIMKGYQSLLLACAFVSFPLVWLCWCFVFLAQCLAPGDHYLTCTMEGILKNLPALFCLLVPEDTFPDNTVEYILEELEWILTFLFVWPLPLRTMNSTSVWSLQSRLLSVLNPQAVHLHWWPWGSVSCSF